MRPRLPARWPLLAAIFFVAYAALLIWQNYAAQVQLRKSELAALRLDTEKRAAAISYFFSERRNDLSDLAQSRDVSGFFANKALKMSMAYGLRANLMAIEEDFQRLQAQKRLGDKHIYRRLALVEPDGSVLVDVGSETAGHFNSQPSLSADAIPWAISVEPATKMVVVSAPVYYKGVYSAQIIAWSDAIRLHEHFIEDKGSEHAEFLITSGGEPLLGLDSAIDRLPVPAPEIAALPPQQIKLFESSRGLWSSATAAAIKEPVEGTPFSLVVVIPEHALFRRTTPISFLLAAASVPFIILVAAMTLGRLRRHHARLKTCYIESVRERGELEGKYTALEEEVRRREEVERQLREQGQQLEARTTQLQKSMQEAHQLARYDTVTGLSNRVLFRESVKQAIEAAKHHRRELAVLFLDLDRFKRINDTLGHSAGDIMLRRVGRRIERCIRQSDTVGRLPETPHAAFVARQGGDEFTILLSDLSGPLYAGTVAHRIIEAISRPLRLDGHEVVCTGSIGISIYPNDGDDVDTLLKSADAAMYSAKEKGRNQYQFFEQSMQANAMRRLALENEMRRALESDEFDVFYQPMLETQTGRLVGVEALLRWRHPQRGLVSPAEFVPVAEESGIIVPLTDFVLRRACRQIAEWERDVGVAIKVAVNLSGRTLELADVFDMIERSLKATDVSPQFLELELTESVLMESKHDVQRLLERLKSLGIHLSIDDFGTGYSSLAYLKAFAIDCLKVDRCFVQDVCRDANSAAIVRTIIAMARTLGLKVVAEGVENEEQFAFLKQSGCDFVQGYLFGRPVPASELTAILAKKRGSRDEFRSDDRADGYAGLPELAPSS